VFTSVNLNTYAQSDLIQSTCRTCSFIRCYSCSTICFLKLPIVLFDIHHITITITSPYLWNQLPPSFRQHILFTLLLVHLILHTSHHHSPCIHSHHRPRPFTSFLHCLSGSIWTAFADFGLGLGFLCTDHTELSSRATGSVTLKT